MKLPRWQRLLRVLAVLAVIGIGAGPAAAPIASAAPTPTTFTPPSTIDASGYTDVSTQLSWWIAAGTADGVPGTPNRIVLNGTYRVEYGLTIGNSGYNVAHPGLPGYTRNHVILDLTNAKLIQNDSTPYSAFGAVLDGRKRSGVPVLSVYRGEGVTVQGGHLLSSNRYGRYSAQREPWHGVEVVGASNLRLERLHIEGVWGDFVYINRWEKTPSRNVVLADGLYDRNGRQGITMQAVEGLEIARVEFRNVQRMLFDHEPAKNGALANADIHDCFGTTGQLGFLNVLANPTSALHDVTVRNHLLFQGHFRTIVNPGGTQRQNFTMTNNRTVLSNPYDRAAPLIQIGTSAAGFDGVTIQYNRDVGSGRPLIAKILSSTNVVTFPNDFPGFL